MNKPSLLLVDDDFQVLESMSDWLCTQGLDVDVAMSSADALQLLSEKPFDVLLVDVRLGDDDGFDLLEKCRRNWPSSQVLMMTGYGTPDSAVEAIRAGAFDFSPSR